MMTGIRTALAAIALLHPNFSAALAPVDHSPRGAFHSTSTSTPPRPSPTNDGTQTPTDRRVHLQRTLSLLTTAATASLACATAAANPLPAAAKSGALVASDRDAPKFVQEYADFTAAPEGWQYKDGKVGTGDEVAGMGDRVVFDWSGYTVGYFGRPFEAKGGPQGGAFDKDLDYSRTVLGSHTVVPALEQALMTMKPGGIRQVLVPYGPLSYPPDDLEHARVGPKPTTFSGQRALNFVLENPRVDRTLLINVKVVRIDKANGKGGFVRG